LGANSNGLNSHESAKSHPQVDLNCVVFSLYWNCPSVMDDECKVGDPYVIVLVLGTIRSPRAAE